MFAAFGIAFRFLAGGLLGIARWMFANPIAALCLALALGGAYEWNRARELDADVVTLGKTIKAAVAARDAAITRANAADADALAATKANGTMQAAILKLQAANDESTALANTAKAAGAAALARLKVSEAARRAAETRETETRSAIYAHDATCNAWGDLPVCPAIADRLRSREAGAGPP